MIMSTFNAARLLLTSPLNDFSCRFGQMELISLWTKAVFINLAFALYSGEFPVLGRTPGVLL